jgi:hypothetical protein
MILQLAVQEVWLRSEKVRAATAATAAQQRQQQQQHRLKTIHRLAADKPLSLSDGLQSVTSD